jgi:hypothetical protein
MDLIWTAICNAVTSMRTHARNPTPLHPYGVDEGYGVEVNGTLMDVTLSKWCSGWLQMAQDDPFKTTPDPFATPVRTIMTPFDPLREGVTHL